MSALPDQEKQGRATWLAAEDSQLLAEHQDLGVLGDRFHPVDAQELNDAANQAAEEAEHHGTVASMSRARLVKPRIGLLDPSGWGRPRTGVRPATLLAGCRVASREILRPAS